MTSSHTRFFDGETAVMHDVGVRATAGELLIIRATDSTILARWPIDEVVVVGDAEHEAVPVLARRRHDARLVIEDHETHRKLVDMVPQFAALIGVKPAPSRRIATFGGALAAAIALLWLGIDWGSGHVAAFVPYRMQAKLGHAALGELVQTKDLCQGEAGLRAVRELANRLARASDYTHPVEVYVVKGGPINAYTLPGGILVFYSDLIHRAKDGTQVAGVLAHEIGHVVHNHPMKGLVRQFGVEIVARALAGGFSEIGALASGGGLLLALRNGRQFEREADATAVELLEAIGVRADGVASFFEQLLEQDQHDTAEAVGIWSSHPPTRERIAATRRPATGRPPFSDVEWKALRDVCK